LARREAHEANELAVGDSDEGRTVFTEHRQRGRHIRRSWPRQQERFRHIEAKYARKTDNRRHVDNRIGPDP
jgi:hypothetical protein